MTRAERVIAALRRERIRQGISQRGMSGRLGRSQAVVGHWERGFTTPSARAVTEWCAALGVYPPADVTELFRRDPRDVPECGTRAGWDRHYRRREYCLDCSDWMAAHMRRRRHAARAEKAA